MSDLWKYGAGELAEDQHAKQSLPAERDQFPQSPVLEILAQPGGEQFEGETNQRQDIHVGRVGAMGITEGFDRTRRETPRFAAEEPPADLLLQHVPAGVVDPVQMREV